MNLKTNLCVMLLFAPGRPDDPFGSERQLQLKQGNA